MGVVGLIMKISTKGRYGLRFMMDITLHATQKTIALKDVAQRQNISEKYLWQVIKPLKQAGFIKTIRGAKGGFALALPPEKITVNDIVSVLEGNPLIIECAASPGACPRSADCAAREMWKTLADTLAEAMRGITLQMLAEKQKVKNLGRAVVYDI